jgi:hypothetical protein
MPRCLITGGACAVAGLILGIVGAGVLTWRRWTVEHDSIAEAAAIERY